MRDTEMIHHSIDKMIHHRNNVRGPVIKRRHRGNDHCASLPKLEHVLDVNRRERSLARDDNQLAAFLQADVGCSMKKIP